MTRKQESVTLSISQEQKTKLENLSIEFGFLWGDKPNISGLMKAIAEGDVLLLKPGKPTKEKRKMIKDAISSIQDALAILLDLI